jgi:hypothetical protein
MTTTKEALEVKNNGSIDQKTKDKKMKQNAMKTAVKAKYVFGELSLRDIMPLFKKASLIYCYNNNSKDYPPEVYNSWHIEKTKTWSNATCDGDCETETEELINPELHLYHYDDFHNEEGPTFYYNQPVKIKGNQIEIENYVLVVYKELNIENTLQKIDN